MTNLGKNGFNIGALLYAFCLPLLDKIANIALIIWLLLSLLAWKNRTVQNNKLLFLPVIFYVSYFIGFFASDNMDVRFIEHKLSLLLYPFLFLLHYYNKKQRSQILRSFVFGLAVAGVACLFIATYNSIKIDGGAVLFKPNLLQDRGFFESILYGGNYFFGRNFSVFHQTVYFAMYLCSGIAVLLFRPELFPRTLRRVFLVFFTALIFLISNKAGFLALMVVFALKIYHWDVSTKKKLTGISIFLASFLIFAVFNPRIKESMFKIVKGELSINKQARYGFSTRILTWDAAVSLIREKPWLGYGHSEVQKMLNKRYQEKGYTFPLKESYNAHNLWMQSWLENGIISIFILIILFYYLFRKTSNQPLYLALILILLLNSLFEGLFNRFSGISFFTFIVCYILSNTKRVISEV